MLKKTLIGLFALGCISLFGQEAQAQMNNLARMYFVTATPGHGAQLETAIKEHAQWRKQSGDPWTWMVYQIVSGEHLGDFVIRSGDHSWADFDAYDAGFGTKGGAHWEEHVMPHVASITGTINVVDTTNVRWPEDQSKINLLAVYTYHLKPGKEQAFTQAVGKIHKAIVEHKYPTYYGFDWTAIGPGGQTVSLVLPFENWAAMQGPEEELGAFLVRAMGQEEAMKTFEQFDSTYHASESMVVLLRRDLSVLPQM